MKKFYFYTYKNESEKLAGVFDNLEDALQCARKYVMSEEDLKNDYNNAWFDFAIDGRGAITVANKYGENFVIKAYADDI